MSNNLFVDAIKSSVVQYFCYFIFEVKSFSILITNGKIYYIKVTQGDSKTNYSETGFYWLTFNENEVDPE